MYKNLTYSIAREQYYWLFEEQKLKALTPGLVSLLQGVSTGRESISPPPNPDNHTLFQVNNFSLPLLSLCWSCCSKFLLLLELNLLAVAFRLCCTRNTADRVTQHPCTYINPKQKWNSTSLSATYFSFSYNFLKAHHDPLMNPKRPSLKELFIFTGLVPLVVVDIIWAVFSNLFEPGPWF